MASNDATIDIPLEQVPSNGQGLRNQNSTTALRQDSTPTTSEKKSFFRGRRKKPEAIYQKTGKYGYDGEEDTVNTMGKIYKKIANFSVVTRYFLYVLPLGALIAVPIIVGAAVESQEDTEIGDVRMVWLFTWIEIVWLSLWVSKVVAHYLPSVFRVLAGTVSSGVRKYSLVIKALEIPLSLVGWAVTSLATFMPLMRRNPDTSRQCDRFVENNPGESCHQPHWQTILQRILAAALIGTCIYLAEKTLIQLISINYHRKQFNARIQDSKRNIWILGLLYDASRYLFPMYCHEFAEEDYTIADQLNLSRGSKTPGHRKSGSVTPMRIIQKAGAGVDKITSVFGHVASEVTGKQVFNPNSAHSVVVEALEKNRSSEALARRLWMSFVVEGRDSLLQEDVVDVLGPGRQEEAEEAFHVLDRDGNGDISLDEMILTVTEWARERKSIASSMHDVDQAVNVLDRMLAVVVFIIVILIFVAFLNASFVTTLATTGTALLSLSFVFAATAQEVLGSCIFLFVKHPFDIGDRVDLSTNGCASQEQFVVEHISLLFTVFRHVQGAGVGRMCQIPNIVLNTLWVENVSRSKAMTEQLSIDVAFETTFDDIQILKNEMITFVTDSNNSRDFQPTVDIDVLGTTDQSKLTLMVEVKHKSNWANEAIRRSRRSKFMCALVAALRAVPVYPPGGGADAAGSAANPTYTVGITHGEAKEHADEAAKGRDDARLVPLKKLDETQQRLSPTTSRTAGAGMTANETRIVDDLTSRNPAVDAARDEAWTSSRDDSSTLGGERPSVDRSDLEEVRGLLRRESTRGKRKISSDYHPGVPTINEPSSQQAFHYPQPSQPRQPASVTYSNYQAPVSPMSYENRAPAYPTTTSPYSSASRPTPSQYGAAPGQVAAPVEMSQIPPQRSPSNPYRQRSESVSRKPLSPPNAGVMDSEEEFGNMRPYSGV
jgi:small-conductance mechanosensitive channel